MLRKRVFVGTKARTAHITSNLQHTPHNTKQQYTPTKQHKQQAKAYLGIVQLLVLVQMMETRRIRQRILLGKGRREVRVADGVAPTAGGLLAGGQVVVGLRGALRVLDGLLGLVCALVVSVKSGGGVRG